MEGDLSSMLSSREEEDVTAVVLEFESRRRWIEIRRNRMRSTAVFGEEEIGSEGVLKLRRSDGEFWESSERRTEVLGPRRIMGLGDEMRSKVCGRLTRASPDYGIGSSAATNTPEKKGDLPQSWRRSVIRSAKLER